MCCHFINTYLFISSDGKHDGNDGRRRRNQSGHDASGSRRPDVSSVVGRRRAPEVIYVIVVTAEQLGLCLLIARVVVSSAVLVQ